MSTSSHAPFYDLFKLIVAIILLLIFLFLIRMPFGASSQFIPSTNTSTPPPPTPIPVSSPQGASFTPTPPPPTNAPAPTETPLPHNTSTPTETPTQVATPIPSPTQLEESLPTPIVEIPSEPNVCAAVSRSQLQVGMDVVIQRYLNLRLAPGLSQNWISIISPGTQVKVIGGPYCTSYTNGGAYLWWQIQLPNGLVGWSAEASAFGTFYFMEPVK